MMKRYERLISIRKECGVNQGIMADIIKKSRVSYCHKEIGKKPFTVEECFLITGALSNYAKRPLTVDEVFKRY